MSYTFHRDTVETALLLDKLVQRKFCINEISKEFGWCLRSEFKGFTAIREGKIKLTREEINKLKEKLEVTDIELVYETNKVIELLNTIGYSVSNIWSEVKLHNPCTLLYMVKRSL